MILWGAFHSRWVRDSESGFGLPGVAASVSEWTNDHSLTRLCENANWRRSSLFVVPPSGGIRQTFRLKAGRRTQRERLTGLFTQSVTLVATRIGGSRSCIADGLFECPGDSYRVRIFSSSVVASCRSSGASSTSLDGRIPQKLTPAARVSSRVRARRVRACRWLSSQPARDGREAERANPRRK